LTSTACLVKDSYLHICSSASFFLSIGVSQYSRPFASVSCFQFLNLLHKLCLRLTSLPGSFFPPNARTCFCCSGHPSPKQTKSLLDASTCPRGAKEIFVFWLMINGSFPTEILRGFSFGAPRFLSWASSRNFQGLFSQLKRRTRFPLNSPFRSLTWGYGNPRLRFSSPFPDSLRL